MILVAAGITLPFDRVACRFPPPFVFSLWRCAFSVRRSVVVRFVVRSSLWSSFGSCSGLSFGSLLWSPFGSPLGSLFWFAVLAHATES
jgi:hypothetical protein